VVVFDCAMFMFDLYILFVCWHGMYIVVTCPMACNVTLWMQINTNTNTNQSYKSIPIQKLSYESTVYIY